MRINKSNCYITKEEAIIAMRKGKNKEESEWAISAVPATRISKSRKVTETYFKKRTNEEMCPHCRKKIEVYWLTRDVPKLCYCFWCGGAIYRKRGLTAKNPWFKYTDITEEQMHKWKLEKYADKIHGKVNEEPETEDM